jgi:hypothetical protein
MNIRKAIDKLFGRNGSLDEIRAIADHATMYVRALEGGNDTQAILNALRESGNTEPIGSTLDVASDLRDWFLNDGDAPEFVAYWCPDVELSLVDWWAVASDLQAYPRVLAA